MSAAFLYWKSYKPKRSSPPKFWEGVAEGDGWVDLQVQVENEPKGKLIPGEGTKRWDPSGQRPPYVQASPNGGSSRVAGEGGYLSLECHLTPKLHALRKKEKPSLDREGVDEVDGWDD